MASQLSIQTKTKNRLDRYKAEMKETILSGLRKERRFISNSEVIDYLLDNAGAGQ